MSVVRSVRIRPWRAHGPLFACQLIGFPFERAWAVRDGTTVTNHIIVTHLHVGPTVCNTTSSLHQGAGRQLLAWSSRHRGEFKIYQ